MEEVAKQNTLSGAVAREQVRQADRPMTRLESTVMGINELRGTALDILHVVKRHNDHLTGPQPEQDSTGPNKPSAEGGGVVLELEVAVNELAGVINRLYAEVNRPEENGVVA